MAQFEKHFVQDLTQDIKIRQCGTIVFNGDNLSNVITVDLYNGTEPYSGGGSVSCSVICPDGATVPITNGSISGNTVTVTLTGDCFALPGQIGVGVQLVNGDIRTTVLKAIYNVELLETDTIVDPGSRITASVGQLVSNIENAVAQIPASDMASMMAGIAPTFSASTNYTAGAYVYYNGTLYRFITAHSAGSWTGTDATQVALSNDLGSQVSDLKSAYNYNVGTLVSYPDLAPGWINGSGWRISTVDQTRQQKVSDFISVSPGKNYIAFVAIPLSGSMYFVANYYSEPVDGNSKYLSASTFADYSIIGEYKYAFVHFTVPDNAHAMRVWLYTYGSNTFYLFDVTDRVPPLLNLLEDLIQTNNRDLTIAGIESTLENGCIDASAYIQGSRNENLKMLSNAARCTTESVYQLTSGDIISISDIDQGLKVALYGYNNGTRVYYTQNITTDFSYIVRTDASYFVTISYTDDTISITPEDINSLKISVKKYSCFTNIDDTVTNYKYTVGNLMHTGNTVPGWINASGWKISTVNPTELERVTDFIPINNGEKYVVFLSIPKTGTITICVTYYSSAVDGDSAFVDRQLVHTGETKNDEKYEFVSIDVDSEQKKYMRITVNTYGKNNYYLFNVTNGIPVGLKALYSFYQSAATDIQIDTQIAQTFANLQRSTSKLENFMYFTDPHLLIGDSVWMKTTDDYLKVLSAYYTSCPVTMTLCGGDWLGYEKPINTFELCYMRRKTDTMLSPFYNVVGNHDLYPGSGSGFYSTGELQNILFPTREHCYYTFDGINTRFYALDTGMDSATYAAMTEYRWEQIAWLGNALKTDDKQNSMILMHIYSDDVSDHTNITPFAENVVAICVAYNNRNTVTLNSVEYDFTNCTGKMRLIICGHNHEDYNLTNSGIPVVCTRNTKSEGPSFDLCCVNYGENKIHMIRVGGGSDRTINLAT